MCVCVLVCVAMVCLCVCRPITKMCVCVNDTFCVCGVCYEACVCACDSVLLVPCLWGRGDEYVELFCQCICLYYIVCITGQKQCNIPL